MKLAKLIKLLKTLRASGLRSVSFETLLEDLNTKEEYLKKWLRILEKNGYVEIVWGNVILKPKLLGADNDKKEEVTLSICPNCGAVAKNGKCEICKSRMVTEKDVDEFLAKIEKASVI